MAETRKIEIFSAGCPLCEETVELVKDLACPSCEIKIVTMQEKQGMARARELGVRSVPAVAINGKLADCCAGRGTDPAILKAAGLGQPID
jgi:glutaredoxin